MQIDKLYDDMLGTAHRLFVSGVMSASGHGNMSARIDDRSMLMTTVGVMRGLTREQLAVVSLDGTILSGEMSAENREIISMHAGAYRTSTQIGGVVHAHSPALTAFALANRPLPSRHETMIRFGQGEPISVIPWAPRGTADSVDGIVNVLRSSPATIGVLLGNHGILAFGSSISQAAANLIAMEEC